MVYQVSCHRCGNNQQAPLDVHDDWEEISCTECGEFLDTVGNWKDAHSPSYALQMLNMSRTLTLQMAREGQPMNDQWGSRRATA
ncbi:hypothetical protein C7446_0796 [Kushneria sinocarnis]|uniref:Uncharacterized protein n=1 Tax=Kushneria sinocarnis TaxID=595502 RepID=A0A420WZL4_9GAMM|nr:hypothetical protein [Kushneria sinocarnis]RKR06798.1 hypothetical protein C7446_0796 [Kushneria sinocarnis]